VYFHPLLAKEGVRMVVLLAKKSTGIFIFLAMVEVGVANSYNGAK